MTTPTSNVTFSSIQGEFGGSNPISMSEYYRGGGIVNINQTSPYGTIPTSGAINVGVLKGVTKYVAAFSGTISSNQQNLDLRSWALSNGWNGSAAATITIAGIIIGSAGVFSYALTISGSWPGGLTVINNGYILGAGGAGGLGGYDVFPPGIGTFGGPAISVSTNVTFTNNGIIGGGGGGGGGGADSGGGGGGGGGGGAGYIGGVGGAAGTYSYGATDGTAGGGLTAGTGGSGGSGGGAGGSRGYNGGNGGTLGSAGSAGEFAGAGGDGGVGGHALDGKSYVNSGAGIGGTIYGTQA